MRWPLWLWKPGLPKRAATQTWMILTFALFVGATVVAVGTYVLYSLNSRIQAAARDTHLAHTEQIAIIVESVIPTQDWASLETSMHHLHDLHHLHAFVAQHDSLIWTAVPQNYRSAHELLTLSDLRTTTVDAPFFTTRQLPDGTWQNVGAVTRGQFLIGLTSLESPLQSLLRRMQRSTIVGLSLALIMALLGSWVASDRVTRPLRAIGRTAKNITAGNFNTEIRVNTRAAEIQDLATNLNRMSANYRQKIEELEQLTRLQNEFIGNISHEVRNPIFSISGYLEALSSSKISATRRQQFAAKGLRNLQRLGNLFNNLIEIARLQYQEDMVHRARFNLSNLLAEIWEPLLRKAMEKSLTLSYQDEEVYVYADRDRIKQVLDNLIENAIVYSEEGSVRVRHQIREDKVQIEVVDDGRGIPEEHLDHIFERFYRIEPARSRQRGGTGLGLSIVQQILQAHGERIHVESIVGRGTRFWFELPLASSEEAIRAESGQMV